MNYSHFERTRSGPLLPIGFIIRKTIFLVFAILIHTATGTTGNAAAGETMPVPERARSLPQLVSGIVSRSGQLTYITEQDSEVFVFYRNASVKEISDEVLLLLLQRPPASRVTKQSWSTFFRLRTNTDPSRRWSNLQQYLEENLTNLTVLKVARDSPYDAQYDLYAVGIFDGRNVVGIQMFGVAT